MELKVGMYVRYRHLSNTKISKILMQKSNQ